MLFTAHCCGNALNFVPFMVECGVDSWPEEIDVARAEKAKERADGKLNLECSPPVPEGMSPEETEKYLYDYIIRHDREVFLSSMDPVTYGLTPELRKMIYKVDRIIANEKA